MKVLTMANSFVPHLGQRRKRNDHSCYHRGSFVMNLRGMEKKRTLDES